MGRERKIVILKKKGVVMGTKKVLLTIVMKIAIVLMCVCVMGVRCNKDKDHPSPSSSTPTVEVQTPTTTQGDIPIVYTLSDPDSDNCTIEVVYSVDEGATWNSATMGTGGDGTTSLSSSPEPRYRAHRG